MYRLIMTSEEISIYKCFITIPTSIFKQWGNYFIIISVVGGRDKKRKGSKGKVKKEKEKGKNKNEIRKKKEDRKEILKKVAKE